MPNIFDDTPIQNESSKGRCSSCGFLARRSIFPQTGKPEYHEMPDEIRENGGGNPPQDLTGAAMCLPACFVQSADLLSEINLIEPLSTLPSRDNRFYYEVYTPHAVAAEKVFQRDRRCSDWVLYAPGYSPKEHLEMLHNQQWAEMMRQSQQTHLDVTKSINETVQGMKAIAEANDKFSTRMTWLVAGLAFLQVVFAGLSIYLSLHESSVDRLIQYLMAHQP